MDNKFLKITGAVFISLAVIFFFMWLSERGGGENVPTKNLSVDLADFTRESVDKIIIRKGGQEKTLAYKNDKWHIGEEEADDEKIQQLFLAFSAMAVKETVSENEANHSKFEVTKDTATELIISQDKKENVFYVGKAGASPNEFYIRKNGIMNVYLAGGNLREMLVWEPAEWKKEQEKEGEKEGEKEAQES